MEYLSWAGMVKYGPTAILLVFVCSTLIMVLRWVMKNQEKIMELSHEREQVLIQLLEKQKESLDIHTKMDQDFAATMKTANEMQRKEHEEIIKLCDSILTKVPA